MALVLLLFNIDNETKNKYASEIEGKLFRSPRLQINA